MKETDIFHAEQTGCLCWSENSEAPGMKAVNIQRAHCVEHGASRRHKSAHLQCTHHLATARTLGRKLHLNQRRSSPPSNTVTCSQRTTTAIRPRCVRRQPVVVSRPHSWSSLCAAAVPRPGLGGGSWALGGPRTTSARRATHRLRRRLYRRCRRRPTFIMTSTQWTSPGIQQARHVLLEERFLFFVFPLID